jgi:hypothetical protein
MKRERKTFGFVFLEGSYSARISTIDLLSSARTTSVHFIGNAYLPIKKHLLCYGNFLKMDCISSTRSGEVIL